MNDESLQHGTCFENFLLKQTQGYFCLQQQRLSVQNLSIRPHYKQPLQQIIYSSAPFLDYKSKQHLNTSSRISQQGEAQKPLHGIQSHMGNSTPTLYTSNKVMIVKRLIITTCIALPTKATSLTRMIGLEPMTHARRNSLLRHLLVYKLRYCNSQDNIKLRLQQLAVRSCLKSDGAMDVISTTSTLYIIKELRECNKPLGTI